MKFSITLAIFFTGLATASPLLVREPQQFNDDDGFGFQPSDLSLPDPDFGPLDPDFAQPVPVDNGRKNAQGFSQQSCDAVRQNHGPGLAATFGCDEFN
ncbi:hypothetical protein BBO_00005 [Beauveria brongniartii RCEF 3172]|uniref:Uncharacterized protein n=1 Tax=Beauveria brongniartii RCEF 3172 TaxID=1081107 RepID=A0A167KT97_9HYPO|nr:hypothetical protein BBO_00005 [Beauveria brongniartii RCEF 3172]